MRITSVVGVLAIALSQMGGCIGSNMNNAEVVVPFTARVSLASDGTEANVESSTPAISADGRYVAFASGATNLVSVPMSGNGSSHVYRRDMSTGTTELVDTTVSSTETGRSAYSPAMSNDGRFVYFVSAANLVGFPELSGNIALIYRRDMSDSNPDTRFRCVSLTYDNKEPDQDCSSPSVSADGRYVAFVSSATNLLTPPTGGGTHVYRRDMSSPSDQTVMVSVTKGGGVPTAKYGIEVDSMGPSISADGRFVAFASNAENIAESPAAAQGIYEIYRRDMDVGVSMMVSVGLTGQASAPPYGNSRYLGGPAISANGEIVAFSSRNSDLVPNDHNGMADVFVRNIPAGATTRASVSSSGAEGAGQSCGTPLMANGPALMLSPALSADGRFVVFWSDASNLVVDDTNNARDIFVRDTVAGTTLRISVATGGSESHPGEQWTFPSYAVSSDGSFVVFDSSATDLTVGDRNGYSDIFRRGPLR